MCSVKCVFLFRTLCQINSIPWNFLVNLYLRYILVYILSDIAKWHTRLTWRIKNKTVYKFGFIHKQCYIYYYIYIDTLHKSLFNYNYLNNCLFMYFLSQFWQLFINFNNRIYFQSVQWNCKVVFSIPSKCHSACQESIRKFIKHYIKFSLFRDLLFFFPF